VVLLHRLNLRPLSRNAAATLNDRFLAHSFHNIGPVPTGAEEVGISRLSKLLLVIRLLLLLHGCVPEVLSRVDSDFQAALTIYVENVSGPTAV